MYLLNTDRAVLNPIAFDIDQQTTHRLLTLLNSEKTSSIAFQSVLVAAIQILERVREDEIVVSKAAISLAQQQQLSEMLASVDSLIQSLRSSLNDQGARILDLQPRDISEGEQHHSWWLCLAKTIETLNAGIDWIGSIVSGQHKESPTRELANIVAHFLRKHHAHLYAEIKC